MSEVTYPYAVYGTQGGGLVRYQGGRYIFVEAPRNDPSLNVGDEMPAEWGIVAANEAARREMDDYDD